ncbi:MAG TPA: sugar transferase [Nitrospira sp.]|nr:sugar transferase [Nitrospira sp.]
MSATSVTAATKAASGSSWQRTVRPSAASKSGRIALRWSYCFMAIDAALICLAGFAAYKFRFQSTILGNLENMPFDGHLETDGAYLGFLVLYVAILVLVAHSRGLYKSFVPASTFMEPFRVLRSVTIATLLLTAFIYLSGNETISRLVVGLTAVFTVFGLTMWRALRDYWRNKQLARGIGLRHALIIGAGKVGRLLANHLEQNPCWGYRVQGFLDSRPLDDLRVLGNIDDLELIARAEFVDEVFITIPSEREIVKKVVLDADRLGISARVIPEQYDGLAWQKPIESLGEFPTCVLHREPIPGLGLLLKRATDIVASLTGLVLLSPLFAMIGVIIKWDSPGPIFYRARRVGRKGRQFRCYKFRTMVGNADAAKNDLRLQNERQGPLFKMADDPRVTRVGRFLRKYSLDELPQLWNVLCCDMSLVGPRPPEYEETIQYSVEHLRRLDVTPGMTGLWQILSREDPSFEKVLVLDSQYIENWSFLLDLQILLKTIPVVLRGTGQ